MITSRIYRGNKLTQELVDLDQISELNKTVDLFYWVDLVDPTENQLRKIGLELGFHELSIEDAFKGHQRPKLEHFDSHLFINTYLAKLDLATKEMETLELAVFVTANGVITLRDDERISIEDLQTRWDAAFDLQSNGAAFLLWGLLDMVVDSYFDVIENLDAEVDELEDLLFGESKRGEEVQRRSYQLRKTLVLLRRIAIPMREVLNPIIRRDAQVVGSAMSQYYMDIYDHVIRANEWTDSLRDLVTTLLEANLTMQSNRMNLVMKKVTSWAAIIAVPTAITGFFGQNVPYPGSGEIVGVYVSSALIILGSVGLYLGFKRSEWL